MSWQFHWYSSRFSSSVLAIFFSIKVFYHRNWRFTEQQGKGGDHFLFHSTTSTRSRTLRHLFATLHLRWLPRIFNRNACVYQTATRWDLPPYQITICLTDWWCNFCLFTWWIDSRFLLLRFDMGNRWIWTRIDYQPCIISEPTNQVCKSPRSVLVTKCASHISLLPKKLIAPAQNRWCQRFLALDNFKQTVWKVIMKSD